MKKTELKGVYCVPKNQAEWIDLSTHNSYRIPNFGRFLKDRVVLDTGHVLGHSEAKDCYLEERTEIPVSKFIDLLEDRIVGWRLEEIGFDTRGVDGCSRVLQITKRTVLSFDTVVNEVWLGDLQLNIKTFTELETLIRFLK